MRVLGRAGCWGGQGAGRPGAGLAAAWPGAASPVQAAGPGLALAGLEELPGANMVGKRS